MAVILAWIVTPIIFGITFLITTSYFIYKLITSLNVEYVGQTTVRTITVTSLEITCCMGWLWKTCVDRTTNRMALSTFIIWYIINICLLLLVSVGMFFVFYHYASIDV